MSHLGHILPGMRLVSALVKDAVGRHCTHHTRSALYSTHRSSWLFACSVQSVLLHVLCFALYLLIPPCVRYSDQCVYVSCLACMICKPLYIIQHTTASFVPQKRTRHAFNNVRFSGIAQAGSQTAGRTTPRQGALGSTSLPGTAAAAG